MQNIEIRPYNDDTDKEQAINLHAITVANDKIGWTQHPRCHLDLHDIPNNYKAWLVAVQNNIIIGMGGLEHKSKKHVELRRMQIHPDYQGQGIDTKLLNKLVELAINMEYELLTLDTPASNPISQHMYKKAGFMETHRADDTITIGDFSQTTHDVYMKKELHQN
jgi:ribosomal protein S18 acetylase RimI-like enzyme